MKRNRPQSDQESQAERFKEAAREHGCEDSEEAFDEALRKVARHKPKDEKAKPAKSPKGKAKN